MSISPTSHSPTREAAGPLSTNYTGNAPLSTTPTSDDRIHRSTRPNIPADNPNQENSLAANSVYVSQYIPPAQAGIMGLKATNDGADGSNPKGHSRDSVLNLLVAGNQNNLDRQIRSTQSQEKRNLVDLVEKKESAL